MDNYYNIKQKVYKSQKGNLIKQVKDIIIFKEVSSIDLLNY